MKTDTEPTVVGDLAEATALTISRDSGVLALATMSDEDFASRIAALKRGQERVLQIQRELLRPDVDYGTIPGTPKPTLYKPGAEKLCAFYGLVTAFVVNVEHGDGVSTPPLRVEVTCTLRHGSNDGPVVAQGIGSANAWEKKYRYRAAQRSCPQCHVEAIKRSQYADKETGDKGWYCHQKAGGCGAQFHSKDPSITGQECGQVDNPDPYDVDNTLVKMASKRAHVDATLRATATSGLFSQDLEDQLPTDVETGPKAPQRASKPEGKASPALIGNDERKKLFSVAKAAGCTDDELREYLYSTFGFESSAAITRVSLDTIHEWLRKGGA